MARVTSVNEFVDRAVRFRDELTRLRDVVRDCGLRETVKWGSPCFTWHGQNVVSLVAFRSYFGLWFHQGALLRDDARVLVNAQEGRTRAMRQWRMTAASDIDDDVVRAYVKEAKELAEQGRVVKPVRQARHAAPDLPHALQAALDADPAARSSFAALRPGQRREYAAYVAEGKRDATRARRVERIVPMIKAGIGLNDQYRR